MFYFTQMICSNDPGHGGHGNIWEVPEDATLEDVVEQAMLHYNRRTDGHLGAFSLTCHYCGAKYTLGDVHSGTRDEMGGFMGALTDLNATRRQEFDR